MCDWFLKKACDFLHKKNRNERPVKMESITPDLHVSIIQFGTLFHNACENNNLTKAFWTHMPKVPVLHQPTLLLCLHLFKIRAVLKNLLSAPGIKLLQGKPHQGPNHSPKKPQRSCQASVLKFNLWEHGITSGMRKEKEQGLLSLLNFTQCQKKKHSHWWEPHLQAEGPCWI